MPAFREIDVRLRVLNARQFRSELIASGAGVRRFEGSTRTVAPGHRPWHVDRREPLPPGHALDHRRLALSPRRGACVIRRDTRAFSHVASPRESTDGRARSTRAHRE